MSSPNTTMADSATTVRAWWCVCRPSVKPGAGEGAGPGLADAPLGIRLGRRGEPQRAVALQPGRPAPAGGAGAGSRQQSGRRLALGVAVERGQPVAADW